MIFLPLLYATKMNYSHKQYIDLPPEYVPVTMLDELAEIEKIEPRKWLELVAGSCVNFAV